MSSNRPAIDLSSLPPAIRQQVEAGLAKLPPEARKELLEKGSPILEKAIARAKAKAGTASSKVARAPGSHSGPHRVPEREYRGHYNSTVRPGDKLDIPGWAFAVVAAVVAYMMLR